MKPENINIQFVDLFHTFDRLDLPSPLNIKRSRRGPIPIKGTNRFIA